MQKEKELTEPQSKRRKIQNTCSSHCVETKVPKQLKKGKKSKKEKKEDAKKVYNGMTCTCISIHTCTLGRF